MAKATYKANPATVEKYLSGIDYPAGKQEMLNQAKKNNANQDVIDTIDNLPDKTYQSAADLAQAMSGATIKSTEASRGEKVGLQAADEETRERVARAGGEAPHEVRGLQASDEETRERVAHAGGVAPHEKRGLQAASEETRERVAHAGGEASVSTSTAVSAAEVQKFLKGMDYPGGKQDLINKAKQNKAPGDVIDVLNKINDRQFQSAADVSKALGDVL